jgi:hypothetical protein|tara:strand:+ start:1010 stop:1255 length:246 start_codon:yes stop_codon:yes gene_type:complete
MNTRTFGMFTAEGNYMVNRIATAAEKLATADGVENAWRFAERELRKLGYSDEFGEATDTDVRDQLHDVVCTAAGERCNFYL